MVTSTCVLRANPDVDDYHSNQSVCLRLSETPNLSDQTSVASKSHVHQHTRTKTLALCTLATCTHAHTHIHTVCPNKRTGILRIGVLYFAVWKSHPAQIKRLLDVCAGVQECAAMFSSQIPLRQGPNHKSGHHQTSPPCFVTALLSSCASQPPFPQVQQSISSELKALGRSSYTLCVDGPLIIRQAFHPEASKKVSQPVVLLCAGT